MSKTLSALSKRLPARVLLSTLGISVALTGWILSAGAGEIVLGTHTFKLPDGFVIEEVAGPPLVDRPIGADLDEKGRLYVTDSSGSNAPVKQQLEEKPHRVVRLEDTDGDGRFDKSTVFADKMMFPEGILWLDGSLYVGAPPSIWKLTDHDDDGVADEREEWFEGKTLTGCANDLHGPYLGPEGWLYWCKGAWATQTHERPGAAPFVTRAAHIFRRPREGGYVEPVMTGGMDNPVEVAFLPGGACIFTTTFLQRPEGGRRDGLIHAIHGGAYGKRHSSINQHKLTGDLLPVLTHLGPAAPCGLTRYASDVFGPSYQDNLFACLFNMHKVTRHEIRSSGSTFTTRDDDFLVSDNIDFHPTDVLEDADGSLLVVDTGGWYKICCPTSQLKKPDVLGAIYRVRRTGARTVPDPRGAAISWKSAKANELLPFLGDSRPTVRRRARAMLASRGAAAVKPLELLLTASAAPGLDVGALARRSAVWTLSRIDDDRARTVTRAALSDPDADVRQAALHSVSLWHDAGALPRLLPLLATGSAQDRRRAAEALGRIGDPKAVAPLLAAASVPLDRMLEHALTYALIEIAAPTATRAGLEHPSPYTRRVALVALDQMDGGGLDQDTVARLFSAERPALRETASWLLGRHPEWAGALVSQLDKRLREHRLDASASIELERQLAKLALATGIQEFLATGARDATLAPESRRLLLRAMSGADLGRLPPSWVAALIAALRSGDAGVVSDAVAAARANRPPRGGAPDLVDALAAAASNSTLPAAARLNALAALPLSEAPMEPSVFDFLSGQVSADQPLGQRSRAVEVLARTKLSSEQLLKLTDAFANVGPLEINRLLATFEQGTAPEIGERLVGALLEAPASAALRLDALERALKGYGDSLTPKAKKLWEQLDLDPAAQAARLETLLASLEGGDIRRGQRVFHSAKAACSSCHAIGYLGGKVGPDLTRVGAIRQPRDLLEAIVFPSASFVRSYEPLVLVTRAGEIHNGLLREDGQDGEDHLTLLTGAAEKLRLRRADVLEMRPGTVSIMPAGLDQQLTAQELADLVAFLAASK